MLWDRILPKVFERPTLAQPEFRQRMQVVLNPKYFEKKDIKVFENELLEKGLIKPIGKSHAYFLNR